MRGLPAFFWEKTRLWGLKRRLLCKSYKSQAHLGIAYCLLPIAYCLLPIAYCLLPIAYTLLHIARWLL